MLCKWRVQRADWKQVRRVEKGYDTGTWGKNALCTENTFVARVLYSSSHKERAMLVVPLPEKETDSAGSRAGEALRKSCRLGLLLEKLFFLSSPHSPRVDGFRWGGRPSRWLTAYRYENSGKVLDWW